MAAGDSDRNPVEVLSAEFLERIRRGEAVTPEQYAEQHPQFADEIRALFPALLMMEELGDETSDRTSSHDTQSGTTVGATHGRLGDFRLLREVGRGGMGVVYEAEQESLGRRVALKILPPGALTDAKQVRRFEREARSAARLHHTNIVPIFGVGQFKGTHYYVMQFIQGQGLDAVLAELKKLRELRTTKSAFTKPPERSERRHDAADIAHSLVTGRFGPVAGDVAAHGVSAATEAWSSPAAPLSNASTLHSDTSSHGATSVSGVSTLSETDRRFAQGVARIGVQVAEALAHAHGQGILHRDIKPSNLLLDRDGNVWVTDFGLAKATGGDDLTHTGDIIGTVRYMAPERFQGTGDARADLYALGLTLYELLALRPAFDETDRASLVRQVTQEDPPRLRRLNRHVPPDLETIIHKTIARDPGHRYETARMMSDDLQRFQDGRPILARQVSTTERLYRWMRRNPALAASLALVAVLMVATTVGAIVAAARFRNTAEAAHLAAADAEIARKHADASRRLAEQASREAEARRIDAEGQRRRAQASLAESQASLALARKAVDDSFTKVSESTLVNVPGLRPLRRELLQSALGFYEEFARRGGDEPGVLSDLAATQARVGQILSDLGDREKARVALRRAIELYDKTLAARPEDVTLLERQSEVWHRLGDLDYRSDPAAANAAYQKAIVIRERLAAAHPAESRFRMALSRTFNGVAITTGGNAQIDAYKRSLELRLKLAGEIPEDPDLLHGLSESFLNVGILLNGKGHREEAFELVKRGTEYGRAGLARRPHDIEFAMDLSGSYSTAANMSWALGRRDESVAISLEGVNYLRKLVTDNPDVPIYRDLLGSALAVHAEYARVLGRTEEALSFGRQAAETLEQKPDADGDAFATAAFQRTRNVGLLIDKLAGQDFKSWPEAARREADLAIADLKAATARGFRRTDLVRADPVWKSLISRDELKPVLAEMERPPSATAPVIAKTVVPSPMDNPGRFDEDRLLGELSIGLLDDQSDHQTPDQLESMLARIDASRKSSPNSPTLEQSARSIRVKIGEQLWRDGELAAAKRAWDDVLAPISSMSADDPGRQSVAARLAPAVKRIIDRFMERGLWEQAAQYDQYYRAAGPDIRADRCYESALLALARNDVATYREIAAEGVRRWSKSDDYWRFNAIRTATLSPDSGASPTTLVAMGEPLVASPRRDGWYGWYQTALANALFRANRDEQALAILGNEASPVNGKTIVALIHARAGRRDQAVSWLRTLERDLEQRTREAHFTFGALRQPHYSALDNLRADLLRRQAYALLKQTAPELRSLRLLRGDAFWRLGEKEKAETELAAAVAQTPGDAAAFTDRARVFETLGNRDRADLDLAEASRRWPTDPRPWVARGKILAERGDGSEADVAYARAASLAAGRLDPFFEAGWWVVGSDSAAGTAPVSALENPDPTSPPAGQARIPARWKPACVNEDRNLRTDLYAKPKDLSIAAMTHLASDRERTAILCLGTSETTYLWLNDRLVFDPRQPHRYQLGPELLVPITLRAGRNTLVAQVGHQRIDQWKWIRLRAMDMELDSAYLQAEFGRWSVAADSFDRAQARGQFLHPWAKARQVELLAALGDRDRYLRAVASFADWPAEIRADHSDVAFAAGLIPNELLSPDRLIELAGQGIAANPAQNWRKLALGLAYYRAGRYREACKQLAQRLDHRDVELPILAMAHWRLGEKDQAKKSLALADARFETWCRERSGGRATTWGEWWYNGPQLLALRREAHELIDGRAIDDAASLAKVRAAMGDLIDQRDSPTWAYDMALRFDPANAEYRKGLIGRLLELGRHAEAEPLIEAMIEGKTDKPDSWFNRGLLLAEANKPDRAAADFAQAMALVPENFDTWGPRAQLCDRMAAHTAAYDRLLELRPSDSLLWYIKAEHQMLRGKYPAAVADFVRCGEPPATNEFAYIYGATLLLAGEDSNYREYVVRQADRHGNDSEPFTNYVLARLAALAERPPLPPDRIVTWANRAAESQPPRAWYLHVQAISLMRAGNDRAAVRSVDSSRALGWDAGGQALNDLVECIIQNRKGGRGTQAVKQYERASAIFDHPPRFHSDGPILLTDWMEFEILRRQIEGPILDAGFPSNPFAP